MIKDMTQKMRTQCVGRYLIDLPEDFIWDEFPEVVIYYGLGADFQDVSVQIVDAHSSPKKFKARVDRRVRAISEEKNLVSGKSMIFENRNIENDRIIIKRYESTEVDSALTYELHQLIGHYQIFFKADSFPNDKAPVEPILIKLSSQIQLAKGAEEARPGFCLGPVLIDSDNDNEVFINTNAVSTRYPDVSFDLYMNAISKDGSERLPDQVARGLAVSGVKAKILRKQETKMGSMDADEVLMRFKENDQVMHSFAAWSRRDDPSLARPSINLGFETGGEISSSPPPDLLRYNDDSDRPRGPAPRSVSSSLTDNEAIGLWDAVLKSVRLRPGAVRGAK